MLEGSYLVQRRSHHYFRKDDCFSASPDDILTPDDVINIFADVETTDADDAAKSLYDHDVDVLEALHRHTWLNIVDDALVHKWQDRHGSLDTQKHPVGRSSTASRLSYEIAVALAIQYDIEIEIENLNISTAFLQGHKIVV